MKSLKIFFSILIFLAAGSSQYASESYYGMVSFVVGKSYVINHDGKKTEITLGQKILPEDTIETTSNGIVRVQIADIFLCHIDKNSKVVFQEIINNTNSDNLNIYVDHGQIMSKLLHDNPKRKSRLSITTPTITAGVRGTEFMVVESEGGDVSSGVYVKDGNVAVESADGKFKVNVEKGQQAVLKESGLLKTVLEEAAAEQMKILEELKVMKEYNCKLIDEQLEKNRKLLEEMK